MIRILFVTGQFNVAGTETFIMNVLRTSNRNRFTYDILTFKERSNKYVEEARSLGCSIITLASRNSSPIRYFTQLNSFFKENAHSYNVVHWCGGNISSIAPIYFAWKYKIPIRIVHAHSSSSMGLHTKILHLINRCFVPFLCNYLFSCSSLASSYFFRYNNAIIIKNGIDVNRYKYDDDVRTLLRLKLGYSNKDIVLGHVGRFDKNKNQTFLVDILSELLKTNNNFKLLLVGDGETFDVVKEKIQSLGLNNHVLMLGNRRDVNVLYQAMDCFVMPSYYEGLPFVLVEAQAASLPCVISETINDDAKIIPLVIKKNLNGGVKQWSDAIHDIILKPRKDLSKYVIKKGFSIVDTVKYLESVYSQNNNYESNECVV